MNKELAWDILQKAVKKWGDPYILGKTLGCTGGPWIVEKILKLGYVDTKYFKYFEKLEKHLND